MGFFDSKWIVEYEYSNSFFCFYKKETIVVDASSEYDAKDTAKKVLSNQFKYVKIIRATKKR